MGAADGLAYISVKSTGLLLIAFPHTLHCFESAFCLEIPYTLVNKLSSFGKRFRSSLF